MLYRKALRWLIKTSDLFCFCIISYLLINEPFIFVEEKASFEGEISAPKLYYLIRILELANTETLSITDAFILSKRNENINGNRTQIESENLLLFYWNIYCPTVFLAPPFSFLIPVNLVTSSINSISKIRRNYFENMSFPSWV